MCAQFSFSLLQSTQSQSHPVHHIQCPHWAHESPHCFQIFFYSLHPIIPKTFVETPSGGGFHIITLPILTTFSVWLYYKTKCCIISPPRLDCITKNWHCKMLDKLPSLPIFYLQQAPTQRVCLFPLGYVWVTSITKMHLLSSKEYILIHWWQKGKKQKNKHNLKKEICDASNLWVTLSNKEWQNMSSSIITSVLHFCPLFQTPKDVYFSSLPENMNVYTLCYIQTWCMIKTRMGKQNNLSVV